MEEREETQSGFVVSGADTAKVFELVEHPFDQVALLIEMAVVGPRREPMAAGRNHRLSAHLTDRGHDPVGIVTLIGEDRLG